ncbi:hypothetical protein OG21DRAFT_824175 [Imleria badia]|nr:hypothetical protein OG21DRAFT_824175 [Imleria badia]
MTLVGVANVTPLHSRVYDHNVIVGPPAQLYRLSRTAPRLECSPIKSPPTLGAFDSKDVYILDDYGNAHDSVVYVWVGKDVTDANVRIAITNGRCS